MEMEQRINRAVAVGALAAMLLFMPGAGHAGEPAEKRLTIRPAKGETRVPETLYGVFFEDINFAADGGLYAEMVKNRSFEFDDPFMGWEVAGGVSLRDDGPFENNPHYLRLTPADNKWRQTAIQNGGFCGMALKKGARYRFSVWARSAEGDGPQTLRVELGESDADTWGQMVATGKVEVATPQWKKYTLELVPSRTCRAGFVRIFLEGPRAVDVEHVSLFPEDVWKGRENGMRRDLVEALAELKPGVFRFPGGCVVEGVDLATRYQWKKTLGPVENRPVMENRWHFTFQQRFYPDYYQSHGIGFYEFFLLAEDLGAEPLPVVNAGLICQYMAESEADHAPLDALDEYIQDALDLIEFANGDETTRWGRVRAELGHPEPFGLKYLGIGNEQWGEEYVGRLALFVEALRKACPEIRLIGSSGPRPEGEEFESLWPEMARLKVDLVDEHFYRDEAWFARSASRYDSYDRRRPHVFAGEYACHCREDGRNRFDAALLEAAFMTGIDRNSDVVEMATYAPLFAHCEAWQWRPDLIWFDNSNVVRSVSYHVQRIFSEYRGTDRLRLTCEGRELHGGTAQDSLYASAVRDRNRGACIVKVVNLSDSAQPLHFDLRAIGKNGVRSGEVVTLRADNPAADNTLDNPNRVVPQMRPMTAGECRTLRFTSPARSLSVYLFHEREAECQ